jgi:hypothetical protein
MISTLVYKDKNKTKKRLQIKIQRPNDKTFLNSSVLASGGS